MEHFGTPKRPSRKVLTDRLVGLIFYGHTNMTQNAQTLGIGRTTAYRYWNQWVASEEAQQIDVEWWAAFHQLKQKSPVKAFEGITRLKMRKMPQKIEAKEEITVDEKHVTIIADYSGALEAAVKADVAALCARKQVDT